MVDIQVVAKGSHETLVGIDGAAVKLTEPSVVLIKSSVNDVLDVKRSGTSVVVQLKSGQVIVIENFFSENETTDNSLVFDDGTNQLIWARFTDNEGVLLDAINYQGLEDITALLSCH